MKKVMLIFLILQFFLSCQAATTSGSETATQPTDNDPGTEETTDDLQEIILASWNVRILSDGSRTDDELQYIANIIDDYDIVAIQEIRDNVVMSRLSDMLPNYSYLVSQSVGNLVTEKYGFFWKSDIIENLGTAHIYQDSEDNFIREPYVAHFRANSFDFTLISIHVLFGTESERREEIRLLDDVISDVDDYIGNEDDVILLGDFNFPATESSFQMTTHSALIPETEETTITDTSSYDNFWINTNKTGENQGEYEVYRFDEVVFNNDDVAASLAVSDHRPISTVFTVSGVDDDMEGNWNELGSGGVTDITQTTGDVRIESVTASPTESEQITIKNYSIWPVDLSDWTIGDLNNPTAYGITGGTIIGSGVSMEFSNTTLGFAINNSGEILYLRDGTGNNIDTWEN